MGKITLPVLIKLNNGVRNLTSFNSESLVHQERGVQVEIGFNELFAGPVTGGADNWI